MTGQSPTHWSFIAMARLADPLVRSKLLQAAEDIFAAEGVERAHVEAIANQAGVSKGAFYNHFASKDDAFRELAEGLIAKLGALITWPMMEREAPSMGTFFDQCLRTDVRIFEFIWDNRGFMRVVLEGGRSPSFVHLLDEFAEHSRRLVIEHLEYGKAAGFFRADLDVSMAATFVSGGYDRLARSVVRMGDRPNFVDLLGAVQQHVLHGIACPKHAVSSGVSL